MLNTDKLVSLLADHQTGMSDFQDDFFVTVRAGGTLYGQYKQALRELYKRTRGLRESLADKELLIIDIEEIDFILETDNELTAFEKRRKEVDKRRKVLQLEEAERVINDTAREWYRFYQQSENLKEKIGEITPEKRRELEKDMWMFKLKEMAVTDFITQGRITNNTFEFMMSLPSDMRDAAKNQILNSENQASLISWYETKNENDIIEFDDLELPDIEKLLLETKDILKLDYTSS